jgi:hypothetical protein
VASTTASFVAECAAAPPPGAACGVERWPVKTMSDRDASLVNLQPQTSTVSVLRALPKPASLPDDRRLSPTETTTFTIHARTTVFKLEEDRDIHLVIASPSNPAETMIVEFPDVACAGASASAVRDRMASARAALTAVCGQPTGSFRTCNFEVDVTGVGFFDFLHGQTGVAPNGIELHPVLAISFASAAGPPPTPTGASGGAGDTCSGFASAAVQNWCRNPDGNVLNCSDFVTRTEATRFTHDVDPSDINRLDADSDGASCESLPP